MKVVFLDFDGVLNSSAYVRRCGRCGVILQPEKLALLQKLIAATDAKIVLSTSWREHWSPVEEQCNALGQEINRAFRQYGLEIYDKIPHRVRGREKNMRSWLRDYLGVTHFVVLDDLLLGAPFLREHFVKTSDWLGGLCEEDVEKAIRILQEVPI